MCGVAAVCLREDAPSTDARRITAGMLALLAHRGPDGQGLVGDARTALGMTRLRVRSAPTAEVPFIAPGDGAAFAFNGEVYLDGTRVPTGGLEEARSAAAADGGPGGPGGPEGMYALAHTGPDGLLRVMRDPLGIKPLYLRQGADGVAVASELPALVRAFGRPAIRVEAFAQFLLTGRRVVDGGTLFEDVRPVAPGEVLTLRAGRITSSRRRTDLFDDLPGGVPDEAEVRARLDEAVGQVLLSDRRVGLALSGGLDSTILALLLARRGVRDLRTVSVVPAGGEDGIRDLGGLGLAEAGLHSWQHASVGFGPDDLFDGLAEAAGAFGEPTAMTSVPMYAALARLAREHGITVLLVGEGADELFGGYNRYRTAYASGVGRPLDFYLSSARSALVAHLVGPTARTAAVQALESALRRAERVVAERSPASTPDEVIREFEYEHSLEPLLRRTDHLLMREGVEGRTPFLHGGLPALARRFPAKTLVHAARTKVPLRDAYAGLLPRSYRDQVKRPFRAPVARWLNGPLATGLDRRLADGTDLLRLRLGVRPEGVALVRERVTAGDASAAAVAFALLSTVHWLRWLDQVPGG